MDYGKTLATGLVMFGVASCGLADDPKKTDEEEDAVVIDTDQDDGEVTTTDNSDDQSNTANEDGTETKETQVCGDGVVDADEACDDGNSESRDGCSSACDIETVVFRNLEAAIESSNTRCDDFGCETDYRITLTLNNFTDVPVREVTNIRITVGGHELSSGGISCQWSQWQVEPGLRSEVISFRVDYDTYWERLSGHYPCEEETNWQTIEYSPQPGDRLSEMDPVQVELTGLLDDGAVWTTSATTDVRDLR